MPRNPDPTGSSPTPPATSGFRRFASRRPRLVLLLVNLVGISLLLLVVEVALRAWGLAPGYMDMGYDDFRPLPDGQSLKVSLEYYTDSAGIFRALPDSFNHRPGYHVNSWGFRGAEFEAEDSSRQKVMLIGDSFTWGAHADPIDSSFADRLRKPGRQVFNFGIPGTNPDQYERIAQQYIPVVNPDVVCVFFYMNNDAMPWPNDVVPHGNCYHITNIGWLNAYLEGPYIGGPEETYAYYLKRFNIPPNNWWNRFCAQTVIGSRLWQVMERMQWVNDTRPSPVQERMLASEEAVMKGPYSGPHLKRIAELCKARNIPFYLFVIPGHNAIERPDTTGRPGMFNGLPFFYPDGLTVDDYYGRPDGHFNNHGHRKMAAFVEETIED
jgi:hypothetical protein